MDIKEIKQAKGSLEAEIKKLLNEFENETGTNIDSISFDRSSIVRGYSVPVISKVNIVIKL